MFIGGTFLQIDALYVYICTCVYGTSNTYILYTCETGIPKTYNDIPSLIYYNVYKVDTYLPCGWYLEPT